MIYFIGSFISYSLKTIETSQYLSDGYYSTTIHELNLLGELYQGLSLSRYELAVQKKFFFGDVYETLAGINKRKKLGLHPSLQKLIKN